MNDLFNNILALCFFAPLSVPRRWHRPSLCTWQMLFRLQVAPILGCLWLLAWYTYGIIMADKPLDNNLMAYILLCSDSFLFRLLFQLGTNCKFLKRARKTILLPFFLSALAVNVTWNAHTNYLVNTVGKSMPVLKYLQESFSPLARYYLTLTLILLYCQSI